MKAKLFHFPSGRAETLCRLPGKSWRKNVMKAKERIVVILLCLLTVLCGCDKESKRNGAGGAVPDKTRLSFRIDDQLLTDAAQVLARHPALPNYAVEAMSIDADLLYERITGGRPGDEVQRVEAEYGSPDNRLRIVSLTIGSEPVYTEFFSVVTGYANNNCMYQNEKWPYLASVYDPLGSPKSVFQYPDPTGTELLGFAPPQTAVKAFSDIISEYAEFGEISWRSLTAEGLQTLYDAKKANDDLNQIGWASGNTQSGGQPVKDSFLVAEKGEWTAADEAYVLSADLLLSGVPVAEGVAKAVYDADGFVMLGMSLVPTERSEPEKPLADLPRVLSGLERATEQLPSASEITVTELRLNYVSDPVTAESRPAWVVETSYEVLQPDGSLLQQTTMLFLDAYTGEELVRRVTRS